MASSQIQIPCHVLRDHNQGIRDVDRECRFAFQKNIDELVRDHISNCWDDNRKEEDEEAARRRQHTRILDRWATNQAKDMMNTIGRQNEAELLALSNSQSVSQRASTFLRESSPATSDSSVDVPNLRASSLVQKWKEFEAEAISPRANQSGTLNSNSSARLKRMNSIRSNNGTSSVGSPMGSEADYRFDTMDTPEYSLMGWEPEQMEQRCPSLSDVNERSRVADIVKRLTSGSQTSQSLSPLSPCNEHDLDRHIVSEPTASVLHAVSHQGEQNDLKKHLRVRGRQATKNILMQMEQERRTELSKLAERHAVTQFPQRGRIQSLLRLKLLQRDVLAQEKQRPASTRSELDHLHGRSTFSLLREKFSTRAQQDVNMSAANTYNLKSLPQSLNVKQDSSNERSLKEDNLQTQTQLLNEDDLKTPKQLLNATQTPGQVGIFDHLIDQNVTTSEDNAQILEVDYSMPSSMEPNWQTELHSVPSTSKHINDSNCWSSDTAEIIFCEDNLDSGSPTYDERAMDDWSPVVVKEESKVSTMQQVESVDSWELLTVQQDSNTFHSVQSADGSWLNDLSYPPRDWECRKETWYDENDSDNVDIHALLERRTVSKLLASGFREKMERLIALHLKRHLEILGSVELAEEVIDHYYPDVTDDSDQGTSPSLQLPSPSCLRPWSQDQKSSNNYDQVAYPPLQPAKTLSSDYQETQQCSPFTSRSSLEMELIYDLKGNIEKIQYEMSELRESIKSCIGMQVQLQNVIKQEVEAAVFRTMTAVRKGEATESSNSTPKIKGNCCVCCSTQVDSLLYRCGHMCTCFKCAQELQYSSSRCPICRAPILDVVKAYSDI